MTFALASHLVPYRMVDVVSDWRNDWMEFLRHGAPKLLTILIIAFILLRIVAAISKRMVAFSRRESTGHAVRVQQLRTLASVLKSVGTFIIIFIAVMQALPIFNIDVKPLLASAGVAGLAIGFGAQTLVKDVLTGFFILFENQFDIGDTVKVAGVQGVVEDMKLRSTVLRDANGTVHMVPNSQISIVSNLTRDWNSVALHIAVDYSEDTDKVMGVIRDAVEQVQHDDRWKGDLVGEIEVPGIERVNGREVDYLVTAKVRPGRQYAVSRELRRRIKESLNKNKVKAGAPAMVYVGDLPEGSKS